MNCATCGASLVAGAKFCSECGAAVVKETPAVDPLRQQLEAAIGTHYTIVRELGRGGMGTVFLAHENGLDRDVAIKVLPPERAASDFYRERFRLEARAAARLNHANIVPLHTFGEHDGMLYYVMGYVEGESLADRLTRQSDIGETELRHILSSVASALHYAHGRGVLHRDVKPSNILIEKGSNRPLLMDFGISKLTTDSTQTATGMILGTPDYMSPEQASGRPDLDGRSDLYSLGLVGYAMLSGTLPFQGRTPAELITKRLTTDAPRPTVRDGAVGADLVDSVMKCLAREPNVRWSDCDAFVRALLQDEFSEPEQFESIGLLAIAFTYAGVFAFLIWRYMSRPPIGVELAGKITPLVAALIIVLAIGGGVSLRRKGLENRQIWQTLFREPASWSGWYPAPLRRRGNVWLRLPRDVRALRAWLSATLVAVAAALGPMLFSTFVLPDSDTRRVVATAAGLAMVLTLGPFLVFAWLVPWRLQRRGAAPREAGAIAYVVPASRKAFWSRPSVAAFLDRSRDARGNVSADSETRTVNTPTPR